MRRAEGLRVPWNRGRSRQEFQVESCRNWRGPSREWGWETVGNKTGARRVLITTGHIDGDLAKKCFLILCMASSLLKDKVEKERSASLSEMRNRNRNGLDYLCI